MKNNDYDIINEISPLLKEKQIEWGAYSAKWNNDKFCVRVYGPNTKSKWFTGFSIGNIFVNIEK